MPSPDPTRALARFIRWVMRDTLYHAQFVATVQGQGDDYTLELLPDDERVRGTGLSNVPIRHGLPGVTVRVKTGARVLLGFEAGDPSKPFASLWEPGSLEAIEFDGGQSPIARVGDIATVFFPAAMPVAAAGVLGGVPFSFTGTFATVGTPGVAIIENGAPRAKA